MSSTGRYVVRGLRKNFTFATKDVAHYFPGHMARGMNRMQRKLKHVDCIVEVHDARTLMIRPHLLILNKVDLTDMQYCKAVQEKLKTEQNLKHVLYTNCKEDLNITVKNKIIPTMMDLIQDAPRYNRQQEEDYNILVIGIPNVGKSSLINALRRTNLKKGKATSVGAIAGVTRSVMEKIRVSNQPIMYVYDTPGILAPKVESMETGMKLALCANLKDSLVGEHLIVDYLLFWMNTHNKFEYVRYYNLSEPTDNIFDLLAHVATVKNRIMKIRSLSGGFVYRPNFDYAAKCILRDFRDGNLGKVNLDVDLLDRGI